MTTNGPATVDVSALAEACEAYTTAYLSREEEVSPELVDDIRRALGVPAELAELQESRLAWAIEADRLDVIATAACLVTHPRECGRDESDCTNDDSCPRAEERYATADDLIGVMALSEEVARLTRERDEAQQSLEAARREISDYERQYAELRRDANTERAQFDRVLTHLVPAARQVNGTVSGLVLREQAGDLVKKLITDLETRPAIPADATYVESLKDDLALAGDEASAFRDLLSSIWLYVSWRSITKRLTTEQKELWADAIEASGDPDEPTEVDRWWRDVAPVSGSDTTEDER